MRHFVTNFFRKLRKSACVVALLPFVSYGQTSRFVYDAPGNLSAQLSETPAAPQILTQPQYQVVVPGQAASFSVVMTDTLGITYQWYFNSSAISGATTDSLL